MSKEEEEKGCVGPVGHCKEFGFDWIEGRSLEGVKLGNDMI